MFQRTIRPWFAALACLLVSNVCPASAHVKWFLGKSEEDILRQPKPELFSKFGFENVTLILLALVALYLTILLGRRFSTWKVHRRLVELSERIEPLLTLWLAVCIGTLLIHCTVTRTLFAPNFVICQHCPWWLAGAQCTVGLALLFGLFSRVGAAGLLGLLGFTFVKHCAADCLDLVPLYGVGLYFLVAGRGRWSLDFILGLDRIPSDVSIRTAHLFLRWCTGIGLIILGLDEKLLHPQLSLELLKHAPALNILSPLQIGNDTFILCAGLIEILLGLVVVVGSFPRPAVAALGSLFIATTIIFGSVELFGHLPYYGIITLILLRGADVLSPVTILQNAFLLMKDRLRPWVSAETLA